MNDSKPVLWQIGVSHYAEKARWALDRKRVDHVRRSLLPGTHIPIALWLTGGASVTVPVLQIDGETIGDSTAIIAALEARHPEPALYPDDPVERQRALELEDFFDEEVGPSARMLPFHELIREPEIFAELAAEAVPGPLGEMQGFVGLYARAYTSLRWKANSKQGAELARAKILAGFDRIEAELAAGGGEYLVGDSFTVADLTAASLLYTVVIPPEGPLPPESPTPPAFDRFRASIAERPGYRWVEEMFRRHRRPARPALSAISG